MLAGKSSRGHGVLLESTGRSQPGCGVTAPWTGGPWLEALCVFGHVPGDRPGDLSPSGPVRAADGRALLLHPGGRWVGGVRRAPNPRFRWDGGPGRVTQGGQERARV